MDRYTAIDKEYITYREAKGKGWNEYACREEELKRRLKLYEDTGLEPEEMLTIKKAVKMFYKDFPENVGRATDMLPKSLFETVN